MADTTFTSDIFKFVSLRPPVSIEQKNQEKNFIADNRKPEETPVGKLVATFDKSDGSKIPEQVKNFIDTNKYDLNFPLSSGEKKIYALYQDISAIDTNKFADIDLIKKIEGSLNKKISEFLNEQDNQSELNNIWDRYYAFYILSGTTPQNLDNLTLHLRVFHLLQFIDKYQTKDYETLQSLLNAKPIISKLFTDLPKPIIKTDLPKKEIQNPDLINTYKNLWNELINTHRAINDISNLKFDLKNDTENRNLTMPNKETGIETKANLTFLKTSFAVNRSSFENLHEETKNLLNNGNVSHIQTTAIINQLQNKLQNVYSSISNINDPQFFNLMPNEIKQISGTSGLVSRLAGLSRVPSIQLAPPTNVRSSIKPLGIGDLKVVKQTLKKYVTGEVAHIENVLRGEYKERKYRVLDRTEDIFTTSTETDEETTKDTQTTERFELKKESEKTIQDQMSVQAGVTVSGSYGMVTFGAHGDFAYSTASQESNKNSSNFAREVVDKSVSKIQKKTKEERTTKQLHEVEEIDTHGIDNKEKPDHAIGIYRWVDKHYQAQIYNYGKRMMFEFIIPEPSAFFEFAQVQPKSKEIITAPIVPYKWVLDNHGNWVTNGIITHKDIDVNNYQLYIRDYNVQGVTPPPLLNKTISTSIAKDSMPLDGNPHTANVTDLVVPAGYIAKFGVWWELSAYWSHFPIIEVSIGNKTFRPLEYPDRSTGWNDGFDTRFAMGNNHDDNSYDYAWFFPENQIPLSINVYDVLSFTLNVYVYLERTPESYEQWQIQIYEKIMSAYKAIQAEYEQKMNAQQTQQGIAIQGQNPLINREIEKTELKKQCIKMLIDVNALSNFKAMKDNSPNAPDFDIFDAMSEGKKIQFFEQAFEWENITYLFYPYFWSRIEQWVHKSTTYDTDPLFTKFLQAGSSRVVIPVKPGYNDVVSYYMQSGQIWGKDGNPPLIKKDDDTLNDLYISIADELRNQTDDLANAIPEGDPWEVVLPTTLVYLQKDSDLPTFE